MKRGLIYIALLVIVAGAILFYMNSRGDGGGMGHHDPKTYSEYKNDSDWRGGETDPIVSAVYFTGMAANAYAAAAAIPDVLDHLYCYCYCAEHHGHKSLLTCFTDTHGAGCDVCMEEAIRARELYDSGHSIKEIRAKIDSEFYQPYQ